MSPKRSRIIFSKKKQILNCFLITVHTNLLENYTAMFLKRDATLLETAGSFFFMLPNRCIKKNLLLFADTVLKMLCDNIARIFCPNVLLDIFL